MECGQEVVVRRSHVETPLPLTSVVHSSDMLNDLASGCDLPLPPTSLAPGEGHKQDCGNASAEQDASSNPSVGRNVQSSQLQNTQHKLPQSETETYHHRREDSNSPSPFSADILAECPPIPMAAFLLGTNEKEWPQRSLEPFLPEKLHKMVATQLDGLKAKVRSWDGREYDLSEVEPERDSGSDE